MLARAPRSPLHPGLRCWPCVPTPQGKASSRCRRWALRPQPAQNSFTWGGTAAGTPFRVAGVNCLRPCAPALLRPRRGATRDHLCLSGRLRQWGSGDEIQHQVTSLDTSLARSISILTKGKTRKSKLHANQETHQPWDTPPWPSSGRQRRRKQTWRLLLLSLWPHSMSAIPTR